jgi:radical SAM superfamily enzyme YgiQ (UPF0313 family)
VTGPARSAILVNYVGCPSSLDSLMPDNGLGNLASALQRAGWRVLILDYATTRMIGRLIPWRMRWVLRCLAFRFLVPYKLNLKPGTTLARDYQRLNERLDQRAAEVQQQIAREIVDEARWRDASFVGFKLWTGDGQLGALRIARALKAALPAIRVYGGGPHVELFGERAAAELWPTFDAVALGEGEQTILELAAHALGERELRSISGIAHPEGTGATGARVAELSALAPPSYDPITYPALRGDEKLKLFMIDESRGCPYGCAFCFHPLKSGRARRVRAAREVVELMRHLAARTGSRTFRLAGSNPPPEHRRAIAEELLRTGPSFRYVSFGHTRSDDEDFELLRRSGCISLFFGVESCSQPILDALDKRTTVEAIRRNLSGARRAGIMTSASLIVPCPHDSAATLEETVRCVGELRPDGVSIYLPMVVPGTAWFGDPGRFAIELDRGAESTLMRYQMRFLMPPPLWDPLPYRVNGRSFAELVEVASSVSSGLERQGVLTGVNDSLLIVARELGRPARELRDLNRRLFMTGDAEGIGQLVAEFNRRVCG